MPTLRPALLSLLLWAPALFGLGCDDGSARPDAPDVASDLELVDQAAPADAAVDAAADAQPDAGPPPCQPSSGQVGPAGGEVTIADGALAGAQLLVPPGALAADAPVALDCDARLAPEGWVPASRAIRAAGARPLSLAEPARLTLPLLPLSGAVRPNHLRLFWRPDNQPQVLEPMVVDPSVDLEAGRFGFATPGLGTFQLAHREGAGEPTPRRYTFKAITGVSMGGGAAAYLGVKYHERFDFVGGLGGPVDWPYLLQYITGRLLSGFCAAGEGPLGAACDPPPVSHPWEHPSTYNDWFYADNGGSFDRDEYVKIFQDLAYAYGNPLVWSPDSPYRAPGMDPQRLRLDPRSRCRVECADPARAAYCAAQRALGQPCECDQSCPEGICPDGTPDPHVIQQGFFDDEYNPDGALPVVAYCEGEDGEPLGVLNPEAPRFKPTEIMLAVDLNRNGRRDAPEPVIRNLGEPYADVGCDGVPSSEEPGYDPVNNPDPAGDDYHWYRNGAGTEGNGMRDGAARCGDAGGEPYDDVGIDGVPDTPQASDGGFDLGEGNGRFDPNPHLRTFYERSPGLVWPTLPPEARDRLDVWLDGGIRDIFNFGLASIHMGARLQAAGVNVRLYRDFPALLPSGTALAFLPDPDARDPFGQAGEAVVLAYGDPDASPAAIAGGDGAHVGSADQTLNRFMVMFDWVHNRWPDGDYERTPGARTRSLDLLFDSPRTGRRARYVVTLPPGYDLPENAEKRYPVTLLLHGYGQRPDDLPVAGALLAGAMTRGAWQKAILVYPDGSCGRSFQRQCNDGRDNDGDGALDAPSDGRRRCGEGEAACDDGFECRPTGDGAWCCPAGWADCGPPDPQCSRGDTPAEDGSRPPRCADGVDNDLDGAVDLEDGGCMGDPAHDDEAECKRGSFYTTHVAERDGSPGGPDYEAMLLDLLDDVDRRFRTKAPAVFDHPTR